MSSYQGFEVVNQKLTIVKDPEAQLFYTFDWSDWLQGNAVISTAEYTVTARSNDANPVLKISQGIDQGTKTFVELNGGVVFKSYVVTVKVTTSDGLTDRRNFRVNIQNRSA